MYIESFIDIVRSMELNTNQSVNDIWLLLCEYNMSFYLIQLNVTYTFTFSFTMRIILNLIAWQILRLFLSSWMYFSHEVVSYIAMKTLPSKEHSSVWGIIA